MMTSRKTLSMSMLNIMTSIFKQMTKYQSTSREIIQSEINEAKELKKLMNSLKK